jgi:GST-like protein
MNKMQSEDSSILLYGAMGSGSIAVEAALTVLDLYVTVVSRFGPWRKRFYAAAPKMAEVVRRVDNDPRLTAFWEKRYPFDDGWDD